MHQPQHAKALFRLQAELRLSWSSASCRLVFAPAALAAGLMAARGSVGSFQLARRQCTAPGQALHVILLCHGRLCSSTGADTALSHRLHSPLPSASQMLPVNCVFSPRRMPETIPPSSSEVRFAQGDERGGAHGVSKRQRWNWDCCKGGTEGKLGGVVRVVCTHPAWS